MWENSDDITQKYMIIYKNRKLIKNKLSDGNFIMNKYGKQLVPSDSLIYVIKKMLPNLKMSHIQWKILTDIGKIDTENLVNINNFFKLVEISAKKNSRLRKRFINRFKIGRNKNKESDLASDIQIPKECGNNLVYLMYYYSTKKIRTF